MTKLIQRFRSNPTLKNREALQTYLKRHPMAIVMATAEELDFIRSNNFSY